MTGQKFVKDSASHRNTLAGFRSSTLSAQFNRSFRENPDQRIVLNKVNELNTRYERLQTTGSVHQTTLNTLCEKLSAYRDAVESTLNWLQGMYETQKRLMNEAMGVEPEFLERQIERIKVSVFWK